MTLDQIGEDLTCAQFSVHPLNQKPCAWSLPQLCFQPNNQPGK